MMVSSYRKEQLEPVVHASNDADADDADDDTPEPPTRKQKLIKAGLLSLLAAIVVYVVLDYTVRGACMPACHRAAAGQSVIDTLWSIIFFSGWYSCNWYSRVYTSYEIGAIVGYT